jgi:arylsulfatase A
MLEASRRHFLKAIAAAPLIGSAHRGRERPNLILLMADDLSARELSCYGNRDHATPNLDALARSGVRVETCWATPLCSPTRAELMTGRYGFRTGWYHNGMKPAAESPQAHLAQSNLTFAQLLKAAGYATAICGKWQLNGTVAEHAFDESCLWEDLASAARARPRSTASSPAGRRATGIP